jgi:LPXTG-motif cell wall-anchored protein
MLVRRCLVLGACLALLSVVPATAQTGVPAAVSGELFYTVYDPPSVKKVSFTYDSDGFQIGRRILIANLPGADGIVFSPSGKLIVGGGATGLVFEVDPESGEYQQVKSGGPAAYHVALDPSETRVWTAGLPGALASVPIAPLQDGTVQALQGDDPFISSVGFATGRAFYTASDPNGGGNFGRIDLETMRTQRLKKDLRGAHGITFDQFTGSLLLFGSFAILQIDSGTPEVISSQLEEPGMRFDQGTVDGNGHLFAADNGGKLFFVDYSATRKVGDASNRKETRFLDPNLDDLAPLTGPGARPEPKDDSKTTLFVLIGAAVVVLALAGVVIRRRRVD